MNQPSNLSSHTATQSVWKPHVTVACIVCKEQQFLMVMEDIHGELRLNQPAGHLEPDESLQSAARRETFEETGYQVELESLVGIYQWTSPISQKQFVRFCFAAQVTDHDPSAKLDDGIIEVQWLSLDQLRKQKDRMRSPMIIQSIEDYLAGNRFPLDSIHWVAS